MSHLGTALGLIVLGVYMMFKSWGLLNESLNWIPLASYAWTNFLLFLGIQTVTLTIAAEVLPEKIQEAGLSFCMSLWWIGLFINMKCLPGLNELIGFHGSMFAYSTVCIFGALFTIFYIPETKGKTYQEIMKSLE